jgi:cytochrome c oxidase subunit 2
MSSPVDGVLRPAGPAAQAIAEIGWVLIGGGTLVWCIVMAALLWALRRRRRELAGARGWIVGAGVVVPVLVLSALLVDSIRRTADLTAAPDPRGPTISVIAHQWWWEVRYRDPSRGLEVVLANEIHLPVGRPMTLSLSSDDVIHSFWVPALAGKVDMLPGRIHHIRLQADRPGVYRGQCAEFCGEQHARMALHVVARPPDEFERWLRAQARAAEAPREPAAQRGAKVFAEQRCGACHSVRGLGPEASIGPDLTHLGSRLHLAAGTLPMRPEALREWLADPQRVKPGARMPSYERLDAESLAALVVFLGQLR